MKLAALIIELIGITVASIGVGLEIVYRADTYFLLIQWGAIIGLIGSLIYAKIIKDS